jgi:serralysin
MSSFDGNDKTTQAFNAAQGNPFPVLVAGWTYNGGSGDNEIYGGDPRSQVRFNGSQPITDQYLGHDTLTGNDGNDYIDGRGGNDSLVGGNHNDTLVGGAGDDLMQGNTGNDHLEGRTGNDTLRGGQNDDVLVGQEGNDFVSGDAGNDAMYGGTGADTFNFFAGAGADIVADFNRGEGDSVRIESGTYTLAQVGADTHVVMNDGATLVLVNVNYSTLDSGWIHA